GSAPARPRGASRLRRHRRGPRGAEARARPARARGRRRPPRRDPSVKVGVMGGTFDPIHLGHLRAAENAREGLGLDEVRFLPAQIPPHRAAPAGSARDRYTMVALATALHPRFLADDLELRREGPSYTADTIARMRDERPDEIVLIVGSDTYPELS